MKILTIDIGNTMVKTDAWENGKLKSECSCQNLPYAEVNRYVIAEGKVGCIVSSVRGDESEALEKLRELGCSPVVSFNQEEIKKYSDRIHYSLPIGADRVAAYLGAEVLMPSTGKLVIDMGTAMTIDVVSDKGEFLGGNISIGYVSRLKALHKSTSRLPQIPGSTTSRHAFGENTSEAIIDGAVNGMVGEIKYCAEKAKKAYGIEKLLLTGGDAERFVPMLEAEGMDVAYDPHLVGRGLDFHLRKAMML